MEKLTVIGCGTMGHSIALNAAMAGLNVRIYGENPLETERCWINIGKRLKTLTESGLTKLEEVSRIKSHIVITTSLKKAIEEATFIIEAIPEDIDLKKSLFKKLESLCSSSVVIASNTSGFTPTLLASEAMHPERMIVTHFWNPAHLIPLVEVVRGINTSDSTAKRTFKLLSAMRKKTINVRSEILGFVGNRLQYALFREAQFLLDQGIATKEEIDAAVTHGFGRRLPITGPLLSADMGGLDVFSTISDYLFEHLSNAQTSFPALKNLVKKQKLGTKTGEGYYTWEGTLSEYTNQKRDQELIHFLKRDYKKK